MFWPSIQPRSCRLTGRLAGASFRRVLALFVKIPTRYTFRLLRLDGERRGEEERTRQRGTCGGPSLDQPIRPE
jgi:hypothetical protein